MKTRNKALLTMVCAVLLVVASVLGTMAYLTSTDKVENTFTVGEAVTIELDEAKTDANGVAVTPEQRVQGNEYKLMPGHNYKKDPTVHVTGEDCYVFVTVANGISSIEAADTETSKTTIAAQMTAKGWKAVEGQTNLYVYIGTAEGATNPLAVSKDMDLIVFENFTVKDDADHDALTTVKDAKITINAYAVQKDGFETKTAAEIWNTTFGASEN